jgi:lysophospholipase L1-like esterase
MVRHERELWRRTKAFLEENGIASVDGLDALRAAVARGESPYFSDHDGHPNAAGHRALAAAVAASEDVLRLGRDEALAAAPTR